MKKKQKINIFIPALALEHICNAEFASRDEKIKWAIIRYTLHKDFFNPAYMRPAPYVFLEKVLLKKNPLGYAVIATVEKGVSNHRNNISIICG